MLTEKYMLALGISPALTPNPGLSCWSVGWDGVVLPGDSIHKPSSPLHSINGRGSPGGGLRKGQLAPVSGGLGSRSS